MSAANARLPSFRYLLTIWYQRYEVQRRMAVFYAAASLSGAFSGLLAYAIEKMDGVQNLAGWKWIFILEGLAPIAVSFCLYFILPDKPETASFLTKEEREFVINRIALYTGSGHGRTTNADKVEWKFIRAAFSEWKIWGAIIPFWACSIGTYGCKSQFVQLLLWFPVQLLLSRLTFTRSHCNGPNNCQADGLHVGERSAYDDSYLRRWYDRDSHRGFLVGLLSTAHTLHHGRLLNRGGWLHWRTGHSAPQTPRGHLLFLVPHRHRSLLPICLHCHLDCQQHGAIFEASRGYGSFDLLRQSWRQAVPNVQSIGYEC